MNNKLILSTRQKIVIGLTILTFIVLIWQIYSLVHNDIAPTNSVLTPSLPKTSTPQTITPTTADNNSTFPANNNRPIAQTNTTTTVDQPQLIKQLPTDAVERRASLALNQQQYMKTANQYELAKMQRQLLEEQVAIANARRSIADTEQQTQKILGGDSSNFAGIQEGNETPIHLTYISQRANKWHATILQRGVYHDVVIGTTLKNIGKVLYIDRHGVKLMQHGRLLLLTFTGIKNVATSPMNNAATSSTTSMPNPAVPKNVSFRYHRVNTCISAVIASPSAARAKQSIDFTGLLRPRSARTRNDGDRLPGDIERIPKNALPIINQAINIMPLQNTNSITAPDKASTP